MDKSTNEALPKSNPLTCEDFFNAIGSVASAAGHWPSTSPDSTNTAGQGRAPVSRSRKPVKAAASKTNATCGPSFDALSPSAVLQSLLVSRLRARLDAHGSLEYALTWKEWPMQSGAPICALRAQGRKTIPASSKRRIDFAGRLLTGVIAEMIDAQGNALLLPSGCQELLSERPISDSGFTGWPSPNKPSGGPNIHSTPKHAGGMDLEGAVMLAGWPTPRETDADKNVRTEQGALNEVTRKCGPQDLGCAAQLSGWATPTASDCADREPQPGQTMTGKLPNGDKVTVRLSEFTKIALAGWPSPMAGSPATENYSEAGNTDSSRLTVDLVSGPPSISSTAPTTKRGALNAHLSRWLQGFPPTWCDAAVRAHRAMKQAKLTARQAAKHSRSPRTRKPA